MTTETIVVATPATGAYGSGGAESSRSAVSWGAILAGAFVAGAATLIMLALGSGFGFAAASPWRDHQGSAVEFTAIAAIWLVLTQWFAAGLGGYTAGRLRTRWTGVHSHEVFFRDTAHGFVTWSVATVIVALLAAGAATIGAGALGAAQATKGDAAAGPFVNQVDDMFRSARPDDTPSAAAARAEAGRILARDVAGGPARPDDRPYLTSLVVAHTGLTVDAAQARATAAVNDARQAADKARKTASATAIFTAVSMLLGAFIACVAAAVGGRLRDEHA